MVAAVRVHKHGGPEVLTYEEVEVAGARAGPGPLKQHACGVNYIDTYFRSGLYPAPGGLPFISGNEGAGEVIAVGPGVTDLKVGDRVAYVVAARRLCGGAHHARRPRGEAARQHQLRAGRRHDAQGHDREYLLRRTYKVQKGDTSWCTPPPAASA